MLFLKENRITIILFILTALVTFVGSLRDDKIGTWLIIGGILLTLIVGILSCWNSYKDIKSLRVENGKLKKKLETLEDSFNVKRDDNGEIIDHDLTWKEL